MSGTSISFALGAMVAFAGAAMAEERSQLPLVSESLVEEVMSTVDNPLVFDWRRASFEIEAGYDYIDEANSFETDGWHLGLGFPRSSGWIVRTAIRRYYVYGSRSSNLLGKTPFRQEAQSSRYEIFAGVGYSLLEGRSMTRLSPWITDLEHVVTANLGGHYGHPTRTWVPKKRDWPDPLAGQQPIHAKWVLEVGLRWQIYLPQGWGLYFEWDRQLPLTGGGEQLQMWNHFASGIQWVVGGTR